MKRVITLAAAGLFTTGLAVLPLSAFADTKAPITTDTRSSTTMQAPSADAKAPVAKDSMATKDAGKSSSSTKLGTTATPGAVKSTTTTNHDKGA